MIMDSVDNTEIKAIGKILVIKIKLSEIEIIYKNGSSIYNDTLYRSNSTNI